MSEPKLTIYAPRGAAVEVPEVDARVRIQFAARPWTVVDLLAPPSACPNETFTLVGRTSSGSAPVYESVQTVDEDGIDQLGVRTTLRFKNLVETDHGAEVFYTLYRGEGDAREAIVERAGFDDIANRPRTSDTGGDGAAGWVEAETIATLAPVSITEDQTLYAPQAGEQEDAPPPLPEVQEGALYGDRGTAVKATDRWIYVFVPTWQMDGEEATVSWTVREYEVHGDETYTRVDFEERSRESGGRAAMMLPVAGTEAVATPAVWVSPFRLPKAHVTGALSDELKRREERSPSALTPVELEAATLGERNKRGWRPADGRLQEADSGYQLHVVNLKAASKHAHALYAEYYDECEEWEAAAGSTHQLTTMLSSLLKSRPDLEDNVVDEAFDWTTRYEKKKRAVKSELDRRGAVVCKLLRHRAVRLFLQQHEMKEATKDAGEAWAAKVLDKLSECEPGQKLLIDTLYASSLAKGADGAFTPDVPEFNKEARGFEAQLAPDAVATTSLSDFNYLSQIFSVGRKSTKKYYGIVEEMSVVIPAAYAADKDGGKAATHLFAALLSKREGTDRNDLTRLRGGTIGGGVFVVEKKVKQNSYVRGTTKVNSVSEHYVIRESDKFAESFSDRKGFAAKQRARIVLALDVVNAAITLASLAYKGVQSKFEALEVTGTMLGTMQTLGASSRGALGSEAIQESLGRLTTAIFLFTNSVNTGRQVANGEYLEATATGLNAASNAISLAAKYGSDSARVVIGGRLLALSKAASTTLNVVSLLITAGIIAYNIRKAYRKDKPWVWVTDHCLWSTQPTRVFGSDFTPRHLPGSMAKSQEKATDLVMGGWKLDRIRVPESYERDVSEGIQTFYPTLFSQFRTRVELGDRPGIDPLYRMVSGLNVGQHYAQPEIYAEAGRSRPLFINLNLPEGPIPPAGTVLVRLSVRSIRDGTNKNWLFRVGYEISQREGGSASGYLQKTYFDRYACWGSKGPVQVPDINGSDGYVKLNEEIVRAFPSSEDEPLAGGKDARHACLAFAPESNPYKPVSSHDEGVVTVPQLRDHVVIPEYTPENPSLTERAWMRPLKVTCTSWVLLPGQSGAQEALQHTSVYDMAKQRKR